MNYRIIGDSCTDLTEELKGDSHLFLVPLSIEIDGHRIEDDETFNQKEFLKLVAESPNCPKSSCPAPEAYRELYDCEGDVYVVTLSSQLSGSYNSALVAKDMYLEEHPEKKIHIFDSKSASVGQTLIVCKIKELAEQDKTFEQIVEATNQFIEQLETKFVLESLETLRKNGRLSSLKAVICNALNIKPVMGATPDGQICKLDQARGINKALQLMCNIIKKEVEKPEERCLAIAHCNNYERAIYVKEQLMKEIPFKDCFIADTTGISSLYANDGGIIVCY